MRSLGLRGSFTQNQEIFPPHDDSSWRRSFGQKLEATSNGVLPVLNEIALCLPAADFNGKSLKKAGTVLFSIPSK